MLFTSKFKTLLLSLLLLSGVSWAQEYQDGMMRGVVRVKFKPQLAPVLSSLNTAKTNGLVKTGIQTFDATSQTLAVTGMKRVFPYSEKHDAKHRKHGLHLWYEVTYTADVAPTKAVSFYSSSNEVALVEPVLEKTLIEGEITPYEASNVALQSEEELPFNDPYLGDQWHYENTGQLEISSPEADVNLFEAWKTQAGQSNVIVSIVDGGIDPEHSDLVDNLWVNHAELNGEEGVDDDGNGYIDDIHGFNFVNNAGDITAHSHGTHVAGTVGAVNNNGIGVAGVAGGTGNGDGVRLQSSQVFTNGGSGGHAAAIVYGADNGAVISQNSWGYRQPGYYESSVLDAINYFIAEAGNYEGSPMQGGIVIFASGNDAIDDEMYPGYWPQVFTVSALGPDNRIAYYSCFGDWVDISAPGGDQSLGQNSGVLSTLPNNSYGFSQGTSMACPHVSGIAALAVSQHGGPSFTADALEVYLTSSTHNIDQYNPDFIGKLGVGYIDAALTLKKNEGAHPEEITDLVLKGAAQDFFNLTWTVPTDSDDDFPSSFQVYYHTEEITEANLSEATMVNFVNKVPAGEMIEFELEGLNSLTTYHVVVLAADRWANVSGFSNAVSGTTNRGPDINLVDESVSLSANESNGFRTTGQFTMENLDEGELKWKAMMRHKTQEYQQYAVSLNYPKTITSASSVRGGVGARLYNNQIGGELLEKVELYNFKDTLRYGDDGLGVIGNVDTTMTNSSALRFVIDRENGFNLTDVEMTLVANPEIGPAIMEIYRGEELKKENLYYAQEVVNPSADPITRAITLEEQIQFENGETIWVVFHIPAGNGYCLGVSNELAEENSTNAFMSFDLGETWEALDDIYDDKKVWSTKLFSKNDHLGEYITLTPTEGKVSSGETGTVQMEVDATELINGSYQANILVQSNDNDEAEVRLPVSIEVSGQEPELKSVDIVDFGNVFFGEQRTLIIPVTNFGYGNFSSAQVTTNDPQFEVHYLGWQWGIKARDYGYITVTYTPAEVGNDNTELRLVDNKGNTHVLRLFGVGTEPAQITLDPAIQRLEAMEVNQTATASFTITNTGAYPLQYKIPSYVQEVTEEDRHIHKFGYSYESNKEGGAIDAFIWEDITETGENITEYFWKTHPNYTYYEIDLGFDFPFYNEVVHNWNITRFGAMTIDKDGPLGNCAPPALDPLCAPKGIISLFGWELDIRKSGGTIHYKKEPGKFILQYTDVYGVDAWGPEEAATFQVALFDNGDIEFRYKDVEGMYGPERELGVIGIGDRNYEDAFVVNGDKYLIEGITNVLTHNETVFRVKHPGTRLIQSISQTEGYLNVNESEVIEVVIDTKNALEGDLYQNLVIFSNDPFNPVTNVKLEVEVNGGGEVVLATDVSSLQFGELFQGATKEMILAVNNTGNKSVEITSVAAGTNNFVVDDSYTRLLKAKTANYITVGVNTEAVASLSDMLTITTSDGQTLEVELLAEVVDAPKMAVDVENVVLTLEAGTIDTVMVTVENTGASALDIITSGVEWLYEGEEVATTMSMNSLPKFSYSYRTSKEENGPIYEWEDIIASGVRTPLSWYSNNGQFWNAIPLPFEVSLYDEPTDTLWVSWQGVVTTVKPRINPPYMDPEDFPKMSEPNSLIAPFFGIHQYEGIFSDPELSGIFHQIFDDRIVITWNECFDKFGLATNYSFQTIIYNNGVIKYQYQGEQQPMMSPPRLDLGIVGLENKDGSDGIFISGFQKYLEHEMAITFTPGNRHRIEAGESKAIPMIVDASNLNAGFNLSEFIIQNNTVDTPNFSIPVDLTVTGEAVLEAPEALDLGNIVSYLDPNDPFGFAYKRYYKEFELKNTGNDILVFNGIYVENWGAEVEYYTLMIPGGRPMPGVTPELGWTPSAPWPFILEPGQSQKMRVGIEPWDQTITAISDQLVIMGSFAEGSVSIPITATVSLAPAAVLQDEEINILANTKSHKETRELVLSNKDGQDTLRYDLSIDYQRTEVATTLFAQVSPNAISSANELELISATNTAASVYAVNEEEESYNAILEYDNAEEPTGYVGYGAEQALSVATRFVAPEEGFNLSHIKTWFRPDEKLSSDIMVYVITGNSIATGTVLTQQSYEHNIEEADEVGSYLTIELDEPQQFFPNEEFFVTVAYPLGAGRPQGSVSVDTPVSDRFYFLSGDGSWLDITSIPDLENTTWMMKAMEKTQGEQLWVSLENEVEGKIAPGDSIVLNLNFTASAAEATKNEATLMVNTNDPINPYLERAISMNINQGPTFVVEGAQSLSVNENDTLMFNVHVMDMEGDTFTYTFADDYENLEMTAQEGMISMVYAPNYEAAGNHEFVLQGEDEYGNSSEYTIAVKVMDVNRAPTAISDVYEMNMFLKNGQELLSYANLIEDLDGDELTYEYTLDGTATVNVYASSSDLLISPIRLGSAEILVTATDPDGLSVESKVMIQVTEILSSNNMEEANLKLYPVPTQDQLTLELMNTESGLITISIFDMLGIKVKELQVNKFGGKLNTSIPVSNLNSGVYILQVESEESKLSRTFIKQ
ncbi:subtilase family N-terminal domain-containing protein [Sediminitomix flava]|uniref:Putative secreted protein (Por secretion system target) n=1 Tax=Sediminitomix flava TaxID=379075 RepID=A0A315ZIJ8_SEDFL|nr:subtilase family N-terminal domain-containing protein [Sediminitomix flava]PWJ44648.1 putative secreted protein (Por secretion system target) [Sediminitomix flava]